MYLIEKLPDIQSLFLDAYPYSISKINWKPEASQN